MKKIIYIALAGILFMQSCGLMFVYTIHQCIIQYEMREVVKIRKQGFQKLEFSLADYRKAKTGDNEISWQNKMYDIKSSKIIGNKVELLVINDSEEETVLQCIIDFTKGVNKPNKQLPLQLQYLFSLDYLATNQDFIFFIPSAFNHKDFIENQYPIYNFQEVVSPPPQLG